jgi:hypothetical protein
MEMPSRSAGKRNRDFGWGDPRDRGGGERPLMSDDLDSFLEFLADFLLNYDPLFALIFIGFLLHD